MSTIRFKQAHCCLQMEDFCTYTGTARLDASSLTIEGCCGGGCEYPYPVKFCPWCGRSWEEFSVTIEEQESTRL